MFLLRSPKNQPLPWRYRRNSSMFWVSDVLSCLKMVSCLPALKIEFASSSFPSPIHVDIIASRCTVNQTVECYEDSVDGCFSKLEMFTLNARAFRISSILSFESFAFIRNGASAAHIVSSESLVLIRNSALVVHNILLTWYRVQKQLYEENLFPCV